MARKFRIIDSHLHFAVKMKTWDRTARNILMSLV